MSGCTPLARVLSLSLLVVVGACDATTSPDNRARLSRGFENAASLGAHLAATPPCTHHSAPTGGTDWFADTTWVEHSVPGPGSSVCIGIPGTYGVTLGQNGAASATVAALSVTGGSFHVLSGSTLTVTGDVDVANTCAPVIFQCGGIWLYDGATLSAAVLNLEGQLGSYGSTPNILRADIVTTAGGWAFIETDQDLVLDKVDVSWTNATGCCVRPTLGGRLEIPASTGNPTVTLNGGAIQGMTMLAGTFTDNGGSLSDVVFDNVNLVFNSNDEGPVTVRSSAGGATLSGSSARFITVEGNGPSTTSTLELLGNVNVTSGGLQLIPGPGAVLNLTGSGTLTTSGSIFANAGAGEVHVQVDLDSQNAFAWDGPTFLDKPAGLYTFSSGGVTGGSPSMPLTVANGASVHVSSAAGVIGDIDVRGSHLTLETGLNGGGLRNREGSSVDLGTGFRVLQMDTYEQDATSTLTLKVGGTTAGVTHDNLHVATTGLLDGTLNVTTVAPFVGGVCGQTSLLLTTQGSVSGTFATVTGLNLSPTRRWGVVYPNQPGSPAVVLRGFDPTKKLGVAPTAVSIAEDGGYAPYAVCLSQQPVADVAVDIAPNAQAFAFLLSNTFSTTDWWQPKSAQVAATDDAIVDPLVQPTGLTHTASSTDPFFNGASAILTANVTDNDGNADLALTITAPPPPIFLNQTFSVSFRDKDFGPTLSTGATFSVPVNPAFRFVSATGATCAPSAGNLICQLAGVAPGGQINFTLTMKPVQRGTFPFTMTLTGQQPDPNSTNNVLTRNITVN